MKCLLVSLALAAGMDVAAARPPQPAVAGASAAASGAAQQRSKMKACNAQARTQGVHGSERRAFMKQCLGGKTKPANS